MESGKVMPLDLEPAAAGAWRLVAARTPGGAPRAMHVIVEHRERLAGELYTSHFATCPYADRHRKR